MVVSVNVGHDAARLTLVALQRVGPTDPKACRKLRRKAVLVLKISPCMAAVRAEAIRELERGCGACRGCRGI